MTTDQEEDTDVYGAAISYINSIPDSSPNDIITTPLGSTFTSLQPLVVCQWEFVGWNPVARTLLA